MQIKKEERSDYLPAKERAMANKERKRRNEGVGGDMACLIGNWNSESEK